MSDRNRVVGWELARGRSCWPAKLAGGAAASCCFLARCLVAALSLGVARAEAVAAWVAGGGGGGAVSEISSGSGLAIGLGRSLRLRRQLRLFLCATDAQAASTSASSRHDELAAKIHLQVCQPAVALLFSQAQVAEQATAQPLLPMINTCREKMQLVLASLTVWCAHHIRVTDFARFALIRAGQRQNQSER